MNRNKPHTFESIMKRCIERENGCIEWTGGVGTNGYPCIRYQNTRSRGNRLVWQLLRGEIPAGLVVMHQCDNRRCLNISHFKLGTQKENIRDMWAKKRHPKFHVTHCPRGHEYNEVNLRIDKRGKKACRACFREKWRERNGYTGGPRKKNNATSKYPGVSYEARQKKWSARINIEGKYKRLGMFDSENLAHEAITNAANPAQKQERGRN